MFTQLCSRPIGNGSLQSDRLLIATASAQPHSPLPLPRHSIIVLMIISTIRHCPINHMINIDAASLSRRHNNNIHHHCSAQSPATNRRHSTPLRASPLLLANRHATLPHNNRSSPRHRSAFRPLRYATRRHNQPLHQHRLLHALAVLITIRPGNHHHRSLYSALPITMRRRP